MVSQSQEMDCASEASEVLNNLDEFYLDNFLLPYSSTSVSPPPKFSNPFATSPNPKSAIPFENSLSPLTIEETNPPLPSNNNTLVSQPLAFQRCHACKGQKYNFTSYFHNKKNFSSPPHPILPLIEDSYILKNTLHSLLVTYVTHEFERTDVELQSAKRRIVLWSESVDHLVDRIVDHASTSAGLELELRPLVGVKDWTKEMAAKFWGHVTEKKKLEFPDGGFIALVRNFRKLWERVWQGYLEDHKNAEMERERKAALDHR